MIFQRTWYLGFCRGRGRRQWVSWAWQVDLGHHPDPEGQGLGSPTAQREEVGVACDVVRGAVSSHAHGTESPVPAWLGLTMGPSILQASVSLPVY